MSQAFSVEPARPEDVWPALRLLYQHYAPARQEPYVRQAWQLYQQGEWQRDDLQVIREPDLTGAILCCAGAGAEGQVWPPQVRTVLDPLAREDALLQAGLRHLQQRGARVGQCLLPPEDAALALPLLRHGFQQVTSLLTLRHDLRTLPTDPPALPTLVEQTFQDNPELFAATLLRTYENTLDFPELNGLRTVTEILASHQRQGVFDTNLWRLLWHHDQPAGVLLLTRQPAWDEWELSYLGLVPAARGQGLGRAAIRSALHRARAARPAHLVVSVDTRNHPAWHPYADLGVQPWEERLPYLLLLPAAAGRE
jgi:ribosomal protein S18 acetylase RimI-like enzyme